MLKTNRLVYIVAGVLCSLAAALVLRSGRHDPAGPRELGNHPPVEELADELKQAWSGHHTR